MTACGPAPLYSVSLRDAPMNLTTIGTGILAFMILDGIWLGFVMKKFYVTRLAPAGPIAARGPSGDANQFAVLP